MASHHASDGFGLLEALVSASLIIVVATGVAQLTSVIIDAMRAAGDDTTALLLAVQKMEQLRSLPWRFDASGTRRVSDLATDLTRDPPGSGGVGLATSPRGSLDHSVSGYVDYHDRRGRWVGTGTSQPAGTSFVRRWSVQASPLVPSDLLVFDVAVLPVRMAALAGWTETATSPPGVVWLTTLRARQ